MFNFTHVFDKTTSEKFYISSASLVSDEGYDETPDGSNWFTVDLEPEDPEGKPIRGLDLIISNDGHISITRNLDEKNLCGVHNRSSSTVYTINQDAAADGKTIVMEPDKAVHPDA